MLAQALDILHQMPGRVVDQTRMRSALPAAALIEQHDAVALRIEETAHPRVGARTGSSMQEHRGFAAWIAAFLEIDLVHVGDAQISGAIGSDGRVETTKFRGPRGSSARGALGGGH